MLALSSSWWEKMIFTGRLPIFIINGKLIFNTEMVSLLVYRLLRCSSFPVSNLRYSECEHRKVTALYTLVCLRTLQPDVKLTALGFVWEVHFCASCDCCRIHNDCPSKQQAPLGCHYSKPSPLVLRLPWLVRRGMWNFLRDTGVVHRMTGYGGSSSN
jgi:hypothetical protein